MSFEKAQQLLELATFVAARRMGVTLDDVGERFGTSRRTAQRIMHALEAQFPDTESGFDEDGHKRWRLQTGALRDLLTLTSDELAALDLAAETLERNALGVEAAELRRLREKIMALVPRSKIARLETDHEALLEAQGLAARPGPSARIAPQIASTISLALKSSQRLKIVYHSHGSAKPTARIVEPYGVLIGIRRYLVAKPKADSSRSQKPTPEALSVITWLRGLRVPSLPAKASFATRTSKSTNTPKRLLALFRTTRNTAKWSGNSNLAQRPTRGPSCFIQLRN